MNIVAAPSRLGGGLFGSLVAGMSRSRGSTRGSADEGRRARFEAGPGRRRRPLTSTASLKGSEFRRYGQELEPSSYHSVMMTRKSSGGSSETGVPRQRSESWLMRTAAIEHPSEPIGGAAAWSLILLAWLIVFVTFPLCLCFCLKVVKEYERAVIFRLGRILTGGARGPGLFFILPCLDNYRKCDLRVVSFDVPPQEILSKDSVTVSVDAVIYFHISNPVISVTNVNDAAFSTKLLAQTTLRNTLGMKTLAEMLSERDAIASIIQRILDEGTDPWGVKVDRVEVKDIRLPHQLMRAMAAEAEAAREAGAKIIAAEGEQKASRALTEAAMVIDQEPLALQLRYLQTLSGIAAEHNSTIVFPVPISLFDDYQMDDADDPDEAPELPRKLAEVEEATALEEEEEERGHVFTEQYFREPTPPEATFA